MKLSKLIIIFCVLLVTGCTLGFDRTSWLRPVLRSSSQIRLSAWTRAKLGVRHSAKKGLYLFGAPAKLEGVACLVRLRRRAGADDCHSRAAPCRGIFYPLLLLK